MPVSPSPSEWPTTPELMETAPPDPTFTTIRLHLSPVRPLTQPIGTPQIKLPHSLTPIAVPA